MWTYLKLLPLWLPLTHILFELFFCLFFFLSQLWWSGAGPLLINHKVQPCVNLGSVLLHVQWTSRFWSSPWECWWGSSSSPYWCAAAAAASARKSGEFFNPRQKKKENPLQCRGGGGEGGGGRRAEEAQWISFSEPSPAWYGRLLKPASVCGCSLDLREHAAVCDSCPLQLL